MIYILTLVITILLFFIDKKKTLHGIKIGLKKLLKILPLFITIMILASISLTFISDNFITTYLGSSNKYYGVIIGSIIGSLTLMPGSIAFPICSVLLSKGVTYMTLAALTNTLMLVGIITFNLESRYFGKKIALARNIASFLISIIIAVIIGIFYGEF